MQGEVNSKKLGWQGNQMLNVELVIEASATAEEGKVI